MNLQELTGNESGVVIFEPDNDIPDGYCCWWVNIDGIPREFAGALVGLGEDLSVAKPVNPTHVPAYITGFAWDLAVPKDDEPRINKAWRLDLPLEVVWILTFEGWH